jgi:hypothetical protein
MVNDVSLPDAGEEIVRLDLACLLACGDAVRKVGERPKGVELCDPGVAELANVGERIAGERGKELFVSGVPRNLLDADVDLGVGRFELLDQRQGALAFGAHRPEVDDRLRLSRFSAAAHRCDGHHERCKRRNDVCTPRAANLGEAGQRHSQG